MAASLITAIMSSQPQPISTVDPAAPPALDHVVKKCLAKDPDQRWQSAQDLMGEMQWIAESISQAQRTGTEAAPTVGALPVPSASRLGWMAAGVFLLAFLAALPLAVIHLREAPPKASLVRFQVSLPEKVTFRQFDFPVISPDGARLAFTGSSAEGKSLLWVRPLDSLAAQPLPGTDGAYFPFWSPDSRTIAFFANLKLKKIDVAGGPPQTLCDVPGNIGGGAWNRGGVIVFRLTPGGLYRVASSGGEAKALPALDQASQLSPSWPAFLPDGRHFLFFAAPSQEKRGIYLGSLDSKDTRRLASADAKAVYTGPPSGAPSGPGYLLLLRGDTLLAQGFDVKKLEIQGESFPVVEQVALVGYTGGAFSVSDNGVLAYRSGGSTTTQLVWFDREGRRLGSLGEPADYSNPALSPDEKKVAVGRRDPQSRNRDIWLLDLARGGASRLTFDPADDLNPVWSPDGSRIAFASDRKGGRDLYQKLATGTGEDEILLVSEGDQSAEDWSADGRLILYNLNSADVWALSLTGDRKPAPVLRGPFAEQQAKLSPDGRWIAYRSNEAGREDVYVQSFPPAGGKWQISTAGGSDPQWRKDGKELFYLADAKMMAVEVKTAASNFEAGIPKVLFEARVMAAAVRNRYLVADNGRRFLINTPVEEAASSPINVVLNWTAGVRR